MPRLKSYNLSMGVSKENWIFFNIIIIIIIIKVGQWSRQDLPMPRLGESLWGMGGTFVSDVSPF